MSEEKISISVDLEVTARHCVGVKGGYCRFMHTDGGATCSLFLAKGKLRNLRVVRIEGWWSPVRCKKCLEAEIKES